MIRPFDILLAGLVVGGAVWTYSIKHEAEAAADRVSALRAAIKREEERIMFLRADWAFLNAPERLERLVARHAQELKLGPVASSQIVRPADLPPPRLPPVDGTETAAADEETDAGFTTGSIRSAPPTSIDDILGGGR